MFLKELHTAFIAPTGVGKTQLALNLLESEYKDHFNFIIIICPRLAHNEHARVEVGFGMILKLFL